VDAPIQTCPRCGGRRFARTRGALELAVPIAPRQAPQRVPTEVLICAGCGRVEVEVPDVRGALAALNPGFVEVPLAEPYR
jgi:hypothetical protein